MALIKKITSRMSFIKRGESDTIFIIKSKSAGYSPFAEKVKEMNESLEKAKLLSF